MLIPNLNAKNIKRKEIPLLSFFPPSTFHIPPYEPGQDGPWFQGAFQA
jgi:hypothetical protein